MGGVLTNLEDADEEMKKKHRQFFFQCDVYCLLICLRGYLDSGLSVVLVQCSCNPAKGYPFCQFKGV